MPLSTPVEILVILGLITVAIARTVHHWQAKEAARRAAHERDRLSWEAEDELEANEYLAGIRGPGVIGAYAAMTAGLKGQSLAREPNFEQAIERFTV